MHPTILALDFDGVLCDGLIEYAQTAWAVYSQIWKPTHQPTLPVPPDLAAIFYRLRPVIETGWEMPVLFRAITSGKTETDILTGWSTIAQAIISHEQLEPKALAAAVDGFRDEWIARDLSQWLALHRFYPGVISKLAQTLASPVQVYIVTTKEGRFVQELLKREAVAISPSQIYGKEVRRPKSETIRELLGHQADARLWFVEDRLKTLQTVQSEPELTNVTLYLADWGYNTAAERQRATEDGRIHRISLSEFSQDFSAWPGVTED